MTLDQFHEYCRTKAVALQKRADKHHAKARYVDSAICYAQAGTWFQASTLAYDIKTAKTGGTRE